MLHCLNMLGITKQILFKERTYGFATKYLLQYLNNVHHSNKKCIVNVYDVIDNCNAKGLIRSRRSKKDRLCNGQKEKDTDKQ
jgi:hypothetical protein